MTVAAGQTRSALSGKQTPTLGKGERHAPPLRSSLLGDEHPLRAGDAAANTAPDHPDEAKDFPDLSSIRLTPRARGEYAG
jgi:hypothetical protein